MVRVLIIEDDALILRMYQKIFSSQGYHVDVATNGEEGLEKVRSIMPRIVLVDIMMPKLNGLEFLKKLKADPELAHIPVVVLTNLTGIADAESVLELGAVKFISKSDYKPIEVFDIVNDILAGYTRDEIPEVS
jgi:CheY-like chemotaxis protein